MERPAVRCVLQLTRDNPIVDDHRVYGVRTLPGVTFLDIVYRLLDDSGFPLDRTELTDVFFVEPVVTTETFDRELVVLVEPDSAVFRVTATSRRVHGGAPLDDTETTHLRATVRTDARTLTGSPRPVTATASRDIAEVYTTGRSAGIEHRTFMRCLGTMQVTTDRVRAELELGDEARATVEDFLLHPALLDGSTMQAYALAFAGVDADGRPLIPLHIESFRAVRPLGDACTVELRLAPAGPAADIVKADIDLYDRSGAPAAQFVGLVLKRVRSTSAITRLTTPTPPPVPDSVPAPPAADPAGDLAAVRTEIVALVRRVADDQGLEVEGDRGFYELGLESTHLLALVRSFEQRWNVTLYPTLLFEYPTVDAVAAHLLELLPEGRNGSTSIAARRADPPPTTTCLTGVWQATPDRPYRRSRPCW